jgi:hypothetical protein
MPISGPGQTSDIAHFLIREAHNDPSLFFDNHVPSDDQDWLPQNKILVTVPSHVRDRDSGDAFLQMYACTFSSSHLIVCCMPPGSKVNRHEGHIRKLKDRLTVDWGISPPKLPADRHGSERKFR